MSSRFKIREDIEAFIEGQVERCSHFSFVTSFDEDLERTGNEDNEVKWLLRTHEVKILKEFRKVLVEKFKHNPKFLQNEREVSYEHSCLFLLII